MSNQATAANTPHDDDALGASKRRFKRYDTSMQVRVHEVDQLGTIGTGNEAVLLDLSRGGLGLRTRKLLMPGTRLATVIRGAGASKPKVYFGVVRRAKYLEAGHHQLGIEFIATPAGPGVQSWMMDQGLV